MAVRLDPWQNIVNVHWGETPELPTSAMALVQITKMRIRDIEVQRGECLWGFTYPGHQTALDGGYANQHNLYSGLLMHADTTWDPWQVGGDLWDRRDTLVCLHCMAGYPNSGTLGLRGDLLVSDSEANYPYPLHMTIDVYTNTQWADFTPIKNGAGDTYSWECTGAYGAKYTYAESPTMIDQYYKSAFGQRNFGPQMDFDAETFQRVGNLWWSPYDPYDFYYL